MVDFPDARPPQGDRTSLESGVGDHLRTPAAHESAGSDEGAGANAAIGARTPDAEGPRKPAPAPGELTFDECAAIADRLWHRDRIAFLLLCLACQSRGMTLLERIRERAGELGR